MAGIGYKGYLTFMSSGDGAFDEDGKPEVVLFVHNGCGAPCDSATNLLNRRNVDYDLVNVDDGEEQVKRWQALGAEPRMPYLVAGNQHVIGYNEMDIALALAVNYNDTYLTPSEANMLDKNFNADGTPKLVMYTMDGCHYCDKARSYFQSEDIPFEERNTSHDYVAKSELNRVANGTPLIFYGYRHYVGWSDQIRKELIESLGS